jgi:RimJ/RimL family protein N-acetyltransferase
VDTVVRPDHRHNGLATMVKADLLLRLHHARPDLVSVGVTCAVANIGMRAVNYRLGFREEQRRTLYRLVL